MSYGDWAQWKDRYEEEKRKKKILFGVGCPTCIPEGYVDCEGCQSEAQQWVRRHTGDDLRLLTLSESGDRIAGR